MTRPGRAFVRSVAIGVVMPLIAHGLTASTAEAATASSPIAYVYDAIGRLQAVVDPSAGTPAVARYNYDNNGNLSQVTDRKGQVTTYTYDGLDRRTQTRFHDAATITTTYDGGNRATQLVDTATGAGTITRSYDGLDRLTGETTRRAPSATPTTRPAGGRR